MATEVINNRPQIGSGAPNHTPPVTEKKSSRLRRARVKPMSEKRAQENKANDQIHEAFLRYNPTCIDCGDPTAHRHHIVSGTAGRAASLFDTDLQLPVCEWCHSEVMDDALVMPRERQLALKLISIVRKHNRYSTRKVTLAGIAKYFNLDE